MYKIYIRGFLMSVVFVLMMTVWNYEYENAENLLYAPAKIKNLVAEF